MSAGRTEVYCRVEAMDYMTKLNVDANGKRTENIRRRKVNWMGCTGTWTTISPIFLSSSPALLSNFHFVTNKCNWTDIYLVFPGWYLLLFLFRIQKNGTAQKMQMKFTVSLGWIAQFFSIEFSTWFCPPINCSHQFFQLHDFACVTNKSAHNKL